MLSSSLNLHLWFSVVFKHRLWSAMANCEVRKSTRAHSSLVTWCAGPEVTYVQPIGYSLVTGETESLVVSGANRLVYRSTSIPPI